MEIEPVEEAPPASLWTEVTPADALGDRLQEKISFSEKARAVCDEHRDPTKKVELVGIHPWNDVDFLRMASNKDMLDAAENGCVADFVKVAKITDPNHPAVLEANLLNDEQDKKPGYSLFVNKSLKKGTILGSIVGKILIGIEADEIVVNAQDGENRLRELHFFDLQGSLVEYGGWVAGDRLEQNHRILLIDASKKTNILTFINDIREDPYKTCSPPRTGVRGSGNVKWVDVRVNNTPRILVVATTDIEKDDEILVDMGDSQATACLNIYRESKKLYDIQKFANQMADKYQQLRDEHQPVITKGVEDNRNVKMTRNIAIDMVKEWEEAPVDSDSEVDEISKETVGSIMATHLIGSLRKEIYEDVYGDDKDLLAETLSEHQKLIYDDSFVPKKPKEVERSGKKKIIWVDDPECERYMEIQAEHGQEIFQEVGRAWLESQNLSDLTSGAQVPWNSKKRRLLENDELVMVLTAKLMKVTGHKPSELGNNEDNSEVNKKKRKFRQIFDDIESITEAKDHDKGTLEAASRNSC